RCSRKHFASTSRHSTKSHRPRAATSRSTHRKPRRRWPARSPNHSRRPSSRTCGVRGGRFGWSARTRSGRLPARLASRRRRCPLRAEPNVPESLPPDLIELRDRMQAFIDDDLRPLDGALGGDAHAPVPADTRQRVRERSRELGFFGMTQPKSFGGSQAGPLALTVVRETLAGANLRVAGSVFGPGPCVLGAAEGDLREHYLEPALRGEKRGAWAFTEPGDAPR